MCVFLCTISLHFRDLTVLALESLRAGDFPWFQFHGSKFLSSALFGLVIGESPTVRHFFPQVTSIKLKVFKFVLHGKQCLKKKKKSLPYS